MIKDNSHKPKTFFSASLPPTIIEEILQQIDENLHARPLLSDEKEEAEEISLQFNQLPFPPTLPEFAERIAEIRNTQAPYYVVSGNPIAKLVKSAHNLVIKMFGRKQAYFNTLTMDLLEAMGAYFSATQEHTRLQSVLTNTLARQITLQMEQFSDMQTEYQSLVAQIEQLTSQQNDIQAQIENLRGEIKALSERS